ncbi:hypothetical protein MHU86_7114 [Fragilaria crotonensis]|nr:hypothetical protein MHU86_7114 [Fragilaria crotonensis]
MIPERSQMIFGVRFGFKNNPSMWKNSEMMKEKFTTKQLDVTISNSASSSGKMVTAGYILLKAPNTTHKLWYNKYLRSLLPDHAPFFDVIRQKKCPMDQLIPHLTIQCGEKHVTPLCQALLPIMTGRGIALFLPRYALGTMSNEQVRNIFSSMTGGQSHCKRSHFLHKSLILIKFALNTMKTDQQQNDLHENG